MKFYNVKTRQSVEVSEDKVELVMMKNNRPAAQTIVNGVKLFKILSKEDAAKLKK